MSRGPSKGIPAGGGRGQSTVMDEGPNIVTPPRRLRRALRLAGWNVLLLVAGLALIGLAGEVWRRATVPFASSHEPTVFVPGVGWMLPPDTEVRRTNQLDFWTVSRTNRLGFLDREPPSPERAAGSCHVTVIGDSFVEAMEVPIADKFHVRLEEMAARALPALDVTTSAFGRGNTGQVNQLAFYDAYARPLRPKLVVLVFHPNDYRDNFPLWRALRRWDPEHLPYVSAARTEDGGFRLRPPDPDWRRFMAAAASDPSAGSWWRTLERRALRASWFLSWLRRKPSLFDPFRERTIRAQWAEGVRRMELLSRHPAWAPLLDDWRPCREGPCEGGRRMKRPPNFHALFAERNDSPFYTEALAFTAFALDEFKRRTERDGAALAILATHEMSDFGGGVLARLNETAAERRIPVIDQSDWIRRRGAELRDAHWPHDAHWNPAGHQWAAEALLEYLKRNRDVCE